MVKVNGEVYQVEVEEIQSGTTTSSFKTASERPAPASTPPVSQPRQSTTSSQTATLSKPPAKSTVTSFKPGAITAPLPGVVKAIKVKVGDQVKVRDVLLVLEAMKMENDITAGKSGIVKEIKVTEGQSVNTGETLLIIE